MKKLILLLFLTGITTYGNNDKYRLTLRGNPATSIVIGWNQTSGSNPRVYYGTSDQGINYANYPNSKAPDRTVSYKGMNNNFVRLSGLRPNTAYYFVINDSQGTSRRLWFKTAPANNSRLSFIAGGDSRNNRTPRQNANRLVAKLKPHAVLFGGDMTDNDSNSQWQNWFNDWQLTIANDGRMFPIIAARGNHEARNNSIYHLFDVPSTNVYYAITFGNNLIRTYTLNTEISISGNQTNWLRNDLIANDTNVIWKMAQYHKPMRPHTRFKSDGNSQYSNWAPLFYDYNMDLVVECDSHTVKSTWPIRPATGSGSDEGFVRDNQNGTVYVGEGCWGAPLRNNDDNKDWTRNSARFNQFKWIFVDENAIETRTIQVDNASQVGEVSNNNVFQIPSNLDIWNPSNGSVVRIVKDNSNPPVDEGGSIDVSIAAGSDDVEEDKNGRLYTNSSDLELVYDGRNNSSYQVIGMRFRGVSLPKNATITSAYLQFTADESHNSSAELEISLHNSGNSPVFSNSNNVSSRPTFANKVTWLPNAWTSGQSGTSQRTPDLKGMIQQLANKNDWSAGNNISFIIKGKGTSLTNTSAKRVADSYEGGASRAARLLIEYDTDTTSNTYRLTTNTTGQGSISGAGTYNQGTNVTVQATPANGWRFSGWSGALSGTTNPGSVTMDADKVVTANFEEEAPVTYTLTTNVSGQGSVNGAGIYNAGTTVSIEAIPENGWRFIGWSGAISGSSNPTNVTMNGNQTITANFEEENDDDGGSQSGAIEVRITNGNDDVEERQNGDLYTNSSDLEMVYDGHANARYQQIGLRFRSVNIPQGASISSAYLQFTADESHNANAELEIALHDNANSPAFSSSNKVSNRNTLSSKVSWEPSSWSRGQAGNAQRSPDLKGMIQQLVDKGAWNAGNNLSFIIKGKGVSLSNRSAKRVADSYEGGASRAARLLVEYTFRSSVSDICNGVPQWESEVDYVVGNQVIYSEFLFERVTEGWKYIAPCEEGIKSSQSITYPPLSQKEFIIHPNPFEEILYLETSGLRLGQKYQLKMYDLQGKLLFETVIQNQKGKESMQLQPNVHKRGLYLLSITDMSGQIIKTLRLYRN